MNIHESWKREKFWKMKLKSKKHTDLTSPLFDPKQVIDRENFSAINGGLADDAPSSSDVAYNDTNNKSTGTYDVAVPSLVDVVDTLTRFDKPSWSYTRQPGCLNRTGLLSLTFQNVDYKTGIMKKTKSIADLSSKLYSNDTIVDRENYVSINGGLAEDNKSDAKVGGYQDTCNQSSGSYDVVIPTLIDILDTKDSTDKPA